MLKIKKINYMRKLCLILWKKDFFKDFLDYLKEINKLEKIILLDL